MIVFEFSNDDMVYAEKICELSDMSTIIVSPKSISGELNDIVQVAVQLAPYAISAVALIIVEMIKNSKKVIIKTSKESLETQGLPAKESIELAREYIRKQKEEKALEVLIKLFTEQEYEDE